MPEIWKHHPGYNESRANVKAQPLEDDLRLIDMLEGRDRLRYGATPDDVKEEALRQHEREWRSMRNDLAEFMLEAYGRR